MIVIRLVQSTDNLESIYNNIYMQLVEHHNKLNPKYKEFISKNALVKNIVISSLDTVHSYIAVDTATGECVGLLIGRQCSNRVFSLDDLYVVPKYRGRGIGSSLTRRFIISHKKFEIVSFVLKENAPALNFYKEFGFEIIDPNVELTHDIKGYLIKRKGR